MEWSDEALVIAVRPHGETAAVVELFSRAHGRHLGLVHGGRSRRLRPVLQTGNHVAASWKARLADQLGHMSVELRTGYASRALEDAEALAALTSMAGLLRLLPERDPHPSLFEISLFVLGYLDEAAVWPALYVRWELALLDELGFGLDLTRCASSGETGNLVYVSPRSGRAVSAVAGAPFADRLLALPGFLTRGREAEAGAAQIREGLALTGYFLASRVLEPAGLAMPEARNRLADLLTRG